MSQEKVCASTLKDAEWMMWEGATFVDAQKVMT